jgi:hypothetical protein
MTDLLGSGTSRWDVLVAIRCYLLASVKRRYRLLNDVPVQRLVAQLTVGNRLLGGYSCLR